MRFQETRLKGAFTIDLEAIEDERGLFARSFCEREFSELRLNPKIAQCNISFNRRRGTLRGMHYQAAPHEEAKVVRCTAGAAYDVIIDLRKGSPTFKQWIDVELTADNRRSLYIPEGFAHGFQTLEDNTELFYLMSEFYSPQCQQGVRWNDPAFGIRWPIADVIMSDKDRLYPDFKL